MTAWKSWWACPFLLFVSLTSRAEEGPTIAAVADAVVAARAQGDTGAIRARAQAGEPDPWLVVEELCARGEPEAATAFAEAAGPPAAERLSAYVASRLGRSHDASVRRTLVGAEAALAANRGAEALAALSSIGDGGPDASEVLRVRILWTRGQAEAALDQPLAAENSYLEAADLAEALGWSRRVREAADRSAASAYRRSDGTAARERWERSLAIYRAAGDREGEAWTLGSLGNAHHVAEEYPQARQRHESALRLHEALGNLRGIARDVGNLAMACSSVGEYVTAMALHQRSLGLEEELGNRGGVAITLLNMGVTHESMGDHVKAIEFQRRALELAETLGLDPVRARALTSMGEAQEALGEPHAAIESATRALEIYERLRDARGAARTLEWRAHLHAVLRETARALEDLDRALASWEESYYPAAVARLLELVGDARFGVADYPLALKAYERALRLAEDGSNVVGQIIMLRKIGVVHERVSEFRKAMEFQRRSLALAEKIGDRSQVAATLGNIGNIYSSLGDYPRALEIDERALRIKEELGDRACEAAALGNIGNIYLDIGDYRRALEFQERALKIKRELLDAAGIGLTLGNIANIHFALGDTAKALEVQEESLRIMREQGDRAGEAVLLGNIGNTRHSLGDIEGAHESMAQALALYEELGNASGVATVLGNIGLLRSSVGDHRGALHDYKQAASRAEELGIRDIQVANLERMARAYRGLGRPRDAIQATRMAVREMAGLVRGLSDEQGSTARGLYAAVFETGFGAAVEANDPSEAAYFLESGRAGALLEALHARGALQKAALPAGLAQAAASARAHQAAAAAAYAQAMRGSTPRERRERRQDLEASRAALQDVIERIQREAKAAANLLYPEAAPLAEIARQVAPDEALVLYGLFPREAAALVITSQEARIVPLGTTKAIEAACRAFTPGSPASDAGPTAAVLRRLVVKPLGLGEAVRRLIVSPDGVLSYVPFGLLLGDREVVYVPSATVHGLLLKERGRRGEHVLALGDPDYGVSPDPGALDLHRGDGELRPLPATRAEAKAVGDVFLLGRQATELGLRYALVTRPRWRAVHLACHAILDTERPMFSALALTPSSEDDGFLTALEVFGMRIPADLVVLSACETGKGKIVTAEGIVGLTRAFMFAGAPRVLVSLWDVDDEATAALMTRFYALWKGGKPTAAALGEAQAFVRSHVQWQHPSFWAAWTLWGLPD